MKKNILLLVFGILFTIPSYTQVVEMDYGFADGDNVASYSMINSNVSAQDSALKYVVVAFDSLYDAINNIDYSNTVQPNIALDSFIIIGQHVNNSGTEDTIRVEVVSLNPQGYPTDSVLWSHNLTTTVSLGDSTVYNGNVFGRVFYPYLSLPSNERFGIRIKYYGSVLDTFGIRSTFKWDGVSACGSLSNFSALLSSFYPNSYRLYSHLADSFGMLPTTAGADLYNDCNNNGYMDGYVENHFMQNISIWSYVTLKSCQIDLGPDIVQCGGNVTLSAGSFPEEHYLNSVTITDVPDLYAIGLSEALEGAPDLYIKIFESGILIYTSSYIQGGGPPQTFNLSTPILLQNTTYKIEVWDDDSGANPTGDDILGDISFNGLTSTYYYSKSYSPDGNLDLSISKTINQASYAWSTGSTDSSIVVDSSGYYGVAVMDINGCVAQDVIDVIIHNGIQVDLGPDTIICGVELALDAGPGMASYQWSSGAQTQTIIANNSSTYYVTATDSTGCVSEDSILLLFLSVPTVNLGLDTTYCAGDSVMLDAGTAQSYNWSNGDTTQTTFVSSTGSVSVEITTLGGCTASDTINVTEYIAGVSSFSHSANGLSVDFTFSGNANTYSWEFGDGVSSNSMNPSHAYAAADTYIVQLVITNNCGNDTITDSVFVSAGSIYCFPDYTSGLNDGDYLDGISLDTVNTIGWPTDTFYTDNSYLVANLSKGITKELIVKNGINWGSFITVWIDWNSDGDFEDSLEAIGEKYTLSGDSAYFMLDAPLFAVESNTRLRLRGSFSSGATACSQEGYGETEDYSVNIGPCVSPVASFGYSKANLMLSFLDSSSNASSYYWDFGDGSVDSVMAPTHLYDSAMTYNVTLIVTNGCGSDTFDNQVAAGLIYCDATYSTGSSYGDYLDGIKLGLINTFGNYYTTGITHVDNTHLSTVVALNTTHTLEALNGGYTGNIAAWIDYNMDGDFDDISEFLGEVSLSGADTGFFNFTVPSNAVLGDTRLRVRESFSDSIPPCGIETWGETEDYTVNIAAIVESGELSINQELILYPNPFSGSANVLLPGNANDWRIEIFNNIGQSVFIDFTNNNNYILNSENLKSGLYWIRASSNNKVLRAEFMIH